MEIPETAVRAFANETILRQMAVELARFACNGDMGRSLGDPVFDSITAERCHSQCYAASGDLVLFVLKLLGVQDPRLVSCKGRGRECLPWAPGQVIPRVVFPKVGMFVWARPELRPRPGDVLYLSPPEHVCILDEWRDVERRVSVFEYGQRECRRLRPAGCWQSRRFSVSDNTLYLDQHRLRGWLDLARIPGLLTATPPVTTTDEYDVLELISQGTGPATELWG